MPVDPNDPEWQATDRFALIFRDVAAALVHADPVGLVTTGAPADEYDSEAARITRLVLAEADSREDVLQIAGDVMAYYFGGDRYNGRLGEFADAVCELRRDE
ncbi:hypothetical protein DVA67_007240 [Solirubrobacter sp. CPCC 204708]|uniref:Uncharacterized protein n=1 Tax=Solirubrobacter deserti TaxID=2282478 RepID=A0ABT4RKC0_9ACTN|nr:hypothetical protein [Solirubrobacter deserti]MBE2315764.1 hypothetical protein [Solirubrobacter deserti]MDA0138898.1 hypothetical protein [Solirubrobacter deserti]